MRVPILEQRKQYRLWRLDLACGHSQTRKVRALGRCVSACDTCDNYRICGHLPLSERTHEGHPMKWCADCMAWRAREIVRNRHKPLKLEAQLADKEDMASRTDFDIREGRLADTDILAGIRVARALGSYEFNLSAAVRTAAFLNEVRTEQIAIDEYGLPTGEPDYYASEWMARFARGTNAAIGHMGDGFAKVYVRQALEWYAVNG